MPLVLTQRPRNVDSIRAGAILYGDLGTSKAYVIGLALAIAGYSSFWLILAVSTLCLLVGLNYIIICRCYPNGGGVYASVRNRSEVLALLGAFFITADYTITAALSGLSAFSYFRVHDPLLWTCFGIGLVGLLNFFGPKHTGKQAFYAVIFTLFCLVILAIFSLPHLGGAAENLQPLKKGVWENWKDFVSVIVALSGVEAIANITGVMKLDPGTTREAPGVRITAKKAILSVILEVAIFTSLFSFVSLALNNLTFANQNVYADGVEIRDFLLRYLAQVFVSDALGSLIGTIFAWIISVALGFLLLSAVNTAINGFISVQYLISQDGEIPSIFQKLNRFGVPILPLCVATLLPIIVLLVVQNIPNLADLYAIGFVGAIATNLAATSTDSKQQLRKWERVGMFLTASLMIAIEITLFVVKPNARIFVLFIVVIGLILRSFTKERKEKKQKKEEEFAKELLPSPAAEEFAILCAVQGKSSNALSYALNVAKRRECPLYLLFFREQSVISEKDSKKNWQDDKEASALFEAMERQKEIENLYFCYAVTDSASNSIARLAKKLQISVLILEMPTNFGFSSIVQSRLIKDLKKILPLETQLLVIP